MGRVVWGFGKICFWGRRLCPATTGVVSPVSFLTKQQLFTFLLCPISSPSRVARANCLGELNRLNGRLSLSSLHIGPKNWVFSSKQPPRLTAGTQLRLAQALDQLHALTAEPVAVA